MKILINKNQLQLLSEGLFNNRGKTNIEDAQRAVQFLIEKSKNAHKNSRIGDILDKIKDNIEILYSIYQYPQEDDLESINDLSRDILKDIYDLFVNVDPDRSRSYSGFEMDKLYPKVLASKNLFIAFRNIYNEYLKRKL